MDQFYFYRIIYLCKSLRKWKFHLRNLIIVMPIFVSINMLVIYFFFLFLFVLYRNLSVLNHINLDNVSIYYYLIILLDTIYVDTYRDSRKVYLKCIHKDFRKLLTHIIVFWSNLFWMFFDKFLTIKLSYLLVPFKMILFNNYLHQRVVHYCIYYYVCLNHLLYFNLLFHLYQN